MFETSVEKKKPNLIWKILPAAVALFGALVALVAYLGPEAPDEQGPLTGVLHKGDPDYQWYSKYVDLESGGIKMGKNFAGKRMVIFSGVIKNGGEKALDVVEVKLTLFNRSDPVYEVVKEAIRPGPYTPPIRSLHDRAFTIYLENIPGEWRASQAEMEIHGFRFGAK